MQAKQIRKKMLRQRELLYVSSHREKNKESYMHLKNNEMIRYLQGLTGNPKYCILTEPLWFIPYSLFAPFATLYMYRLGVNDLQIGVILSAGMLVQVVAAFGGGALTDWAGMRCFCWQICCWSPRPCKTSPI